MKKLLLLSLICLLSAGSYAQQRRHTTFYDQRESLFEVLPTSPEDIIFLGNSITNGGEWSELFQNCHVKNRGISGDTCEGVYDRLDALLKGKPSKIFLLIGTNNLGRGAKNEDVVAGVRKIVEKIKTDSPRTKLYLQSIFPTSDYYKLFSGHAARYKDIPLINEKLKELAGEAGITYIDVYSSLVDKATGKMSNRYSNDGLHLLGSGYLRWVEVLKPYVAE